VYPYFLFFFVSGYIFFPELGIQWPNWTFSYLMALINRVAIWDVESTSNDPSSDHIISIGAVICDLDPKQGRLKKRDEFHTYVHTNKAITAEHVHHINKGMLQGQPDFPTAVALLTQFFRSHLPEPQARLIFVAHYGSKFDDVILYCNFIHHRLDYDQFLRDIRCYGFLDSLKFLRALFKGCPSTEGPKDPKTSRQSFALGDCFSSFCN
jgi:DNA polymerase III epsilon subunit-like protein